VGQIKHTLAVEAEEQITQELMVDSHKMEAVEVVGTIKQQQQVPQILAEVEEVQEQQMGQEQMVVQV
jgi:hypothetical protein